MAEDPPQQEPTLKILTSVRNNAEARMVIGDLEAAGIRAMHRPSARSLGLWAREIYAEEQDLDRAREVLNAEPMSEDELIRAEEEDAARHLSQPAD
jgi:Putative prokaryotic signal transducing protein